MGGFSVAEIPAIGAQLALAGVLLWAALAKTTLTGKLRETIRGLPLGRLNRRPAQVHLLVQALPPLLITAELLAATGLLLLPAAAWPRALVLVLALAFAAAGVLAARSGATIRCNCFGGDRDTVLGLRQLRLLPLWATALAIAQWQPPHWSARTGLALFCCLVLGFTVVRLAGCIRLWLLVRAAWATAYNAREPGEDWEDRDHDPIAEEGEVPAP
jgi:hypothetical protein